jgi:hypothetical protein
MLSTLMELKDDNFESEWWNFVREDLIRKFEEVIMRELKYFRGGKCEQKLIKYFIFKKMKNLEKAEKFISFFCNF